SRIEWLRLRPALPGLRTSPRATKQRPRPLLGNFRRERGKLMRAMRILTFVLLFAAAAVGQTNKGGISGTVLDQNGAAIPGATVTITNLGTGQKQTVTTSDSGAFSVNSLDPVTYSIAVEAQGFKTAKVQSLKV